MTMTLAGMPHTGTTLVSPPWMVCLAVLACAASVAGCATSRADAPRGSASADSIQVICPANGDLVQCFAPASARCGREGYDLFDRHGRAATVADARYGALEARCRPRRQPGQ